LLSATAGPIATREDVIRTLNLVLDYYVKNEPSSPVPLLIARARKLVSLSFLEAIRELAPGGLKELQMVAGGGEDGKQQK
jgi:type VI secretion system protein ImpA